MRGKTQGEEIDSRPAMKAAMRETSALMAATVPSTSGAVNRASIVSAAAAPERFSTGDFAIMVDIIHDFGGGCDRPRSGIHQADAAPRTALSDRGDRSFADGFRRSGSDSDDLHAAARQVPRDRQRLAAAVEQDGAASRLFRPDAARPGARAR